MDNIKVLAALESLQQNDERMEGAIAELAQLLRETRETSIQKFAEIQAETKAAAKLEPKIEAVERNLTEEINKIKERLDKVSAVSFHSEEWISEKETTQKDDAKTIRQYVLLAIVAALLSLSVSGALTWINSHTAEPIEIGE